MRGSGEERGKEPVAPSDCSSSTFASRLPIRRRGRGREAALRCVPLSFSFAVSHPAACGPAGANPLTSTLSAEVRSRVSTCGSRVQPVAPFDLKVQKAVSVARPPPSPVRLCESELCFSFFWGGGDKKGESDRRQPGRTRRRLVLQPDGDTGR